MLCPHCKIDLSTIILKGTNIDICPLCHGIFLDKGELEKTLETSRNSLKLIDNNKEIETHAPINIDAGQADRNASKPTHQFSMVRGKLAENSCNKEEKLFEGEIECPRCHKLMQKFPYAGSSDIIIDSCRDGCGIWLDKGEILRIAEYLSKQGKPLDEFERAKLKTQVAFFTDTKTENSSLLDFLNMQNNADDIDKNSKPEEKYLAIVYAIIQGLLFFFFRKFR